MCTLSRHARNVNCVRWHPRGGTDLLCSGGDGGSLFVWHRVADGSPREHEPMPAPQPLDGDGTGDAQTSGEAWRVKTNLETANPFDIYAVEWSADGRFVAAGVTDNCARIYSVAQGICIRVVRDHQHFVNGVCWDPLGRFLVSVCADGSLKVSRVYAAANSSQFSGAPVCKVARFAVDSGSFPSFRLFHDETLVSFFRKPSFSPDGRHVYVPAGITQDGQHCVHVFSRHGFSRSGNPVFSVAGFERAAVGVFFCPGAFANGAAGETPFFIYCVLTQDSVHVFDTTEGKNLLFAMKNYHLGTLTDATWSADGNLLLVSSCDGFVSLYTFAWKGRLGAPCRRPAEPADSRQEAHIEGAEVPGSPASASAADSSKRRITPVLVHSL